MKHARTSSGRVVIANWKMNPQTSAQAKELFAALKTAGARAKRVRTIIAAPFVFLSELRLLAKGSRLALGAQNVSGETSGTHTGEVSVWMLKNVGVTQVIVGHSERRALGDDDAVIAKKVSVAVKEKIGVILCIGESTRDTAGGYLSVVERQVRAALAGVPKTALALVMIAYEPVWAISAGDGKGQTATPADVHEMTIFIRKILTSLYTRPSAERVCILYGGSVNETNASALMQEGMVDGFLVGGASLNPRAFSTILAAANEPVT